MKGGEQEKGLVNSIQVKRNVLLKIGEEGTSEGVTESAGISFFRWLKFLRRREGSISIYVLCMHLCLTRLNLIMYTT